MDTFDAYRIHREGQEIEGRLVQLSLDDLSPGDVVIETRYSSVNYKDAMAAAGVRGVVRRYPLVGGVDLAGTVVSSTDPGFSEGDEVLASGYDLGVSHDGGFAEYARVPAGWVVPLPDELTPFEAMGIGMAGFTSALSVMQMERNGLSPDDGPVLVTGATGGVGGIAVEVLAGLGYSVTALTGKEDQRERLRSLGADEVLLRQELEMGSGPLESATWAGAVDPVGGEILGWIIRTLKRGGSVANSGLAAGVQLSTTVYPFIVRGVNLLGIDATTCPMERRRRVWDRLATDMKPTRLLRQVDEVTLEELPEAFSTLLDGQARGRTVVKIG